MGQDSIDQSDELNERLPTAWRIAPGDRAFLWKESLAGGYITINWLCDRDLMTFESEDTLLDCLKAESGKSNQTSAKNSIWSFTRTIQRGDLVVANRGVRNVVGIGIIRSDYIPPGSPKNPRIDYDFHLHLRRVDWLIHDELEFDENICGTRVPPTVAEISKQQVAWLIGCYSQLYPEQASALLAALRSELPDPDSSGATHDIAVIAASNDLTATEKQRLIDARIGQGRFRKQLLKAWDGRCAVTGTATETAIRASHIKSWCESNNDERLDPENGIPLVATLDALFDEGLISFDKTGRMLISDKLSDHERRLLGVSEDQQIKLKSEKIKKYLQWHRQSFGFEE